MAVAFVTSANFRTSFYLIPLAIVIEVRSDRRPSFAKAGFGEDDLEVTAQENRLTIKGKAKPEGGAKFLHRGIARRAFERRFELADHIEVTGASLDNGVLYVDLVRELPEAMKPRSIKIATSAPKAIGAKAA